jgi:hypothetical protein
VPSLMLRPDCGNVMASSQHERRAAAKLATTILFLDSVSPSEARCSGSYTLEPIQEVRIQEQRVELVNRRSMMQIDARRINAVADRA